MRARPASVLAVLAAAALPLAAVAQRSTTIRCRHVLAEDGASWRQDVVVTVLGTIASIRPAAADERVDLDYGEAWLVPGLIDLHTHMCLRPYDEASWADQVLRESLELRSMRAVQHAEATLLAGFVAVRDLGTEGAGFADVALRTAIRDGIAIGPQVYASTKAIGATGCYGVELPTVDAPKGAQLVTGADDVRAAVREQVAAGADWIKVYADCPRAPGRPATPTFSLAELTALCDEAASAGVPVAAHATTDEGIRRAVQAGVRTVEHGTHASEATLRAMAEKGVVLCPCLTANEAIVRYAGHAGPVAARLNAGKAAFQRALAAGVTVACGTDAGVFRHGENARELELMVEYGMTPQQALAAATSVAARVLGRDDLGSIRVGARAALVVLDGDPLQDVHAVRRVRAVILGEGEVPRRR